MDRWCYMNPKLIHQMKIPTTQINIQREQTQPDNRIQSEVYLSWELRYRDI